MTVPPYHREAAATLRRIGAPTPTQVAFLLGQASALDPRPPSLARRRAPTTARGLKCSSSTM
jgi:hypothetical protein